MKQVTLSIPCKPFGANQLIKKSSTRKGRQNLAALKQKLRDDAFFAWMGEGSVAFRRARYDVVIVFGHGNRRDTDNYSTGSIKFILDGLSGHAFPDDSSRYLDRGEIEIRYERDPLGLKRGRIELTLTEVE